MQLPIFFKQKSECLDFHACCDCYFDYLGISPHVTLSFDILVEDKGRKEHCDISIMSIGP